VTGAATPAIEVGESRSCERRGGVLSTLCEDDNREVPIVPKLRYAGSNAIGQWRPIREATAVRSKMCDRRHEPTSIAQVDSLVL
jgi:hypothetical protein